MLTVYNDNPQVEKETHGAAQGRTKANTQAKETAAPAPARVSARTKVPTRKYSEMLESDASFTTTISRGAMEPAEDDSDHASEKKHPSTASQELIDNRRRYKKSNQIPRDARPKRRRRVVERGKGC